MMYSMSEIESYHQVSGKAAPAGRFSEECADTTLLCTMYVDEDGGSAVYVPAQSLIIVQDAQGHGLGRLLEQHQDQSAEVPPAQYR
jgi:hypothetical protein